MKKVSVILGKKASSFYDPTQPEGSKKILAGQIVEVLQTPLVSEYLRNEGLLLANAENLALMGIPDPSTEAGKAQIEAANQAKPEPEPASVSPESLEKVAVHTAQKEAAEKQIEAAEKGLELENAKQETARLEIQKMELQLKLELAAAKKEKPGKEEKPKEPETGKEGTGTETKPGTDTGAGS